MKSELVLPYHSFCQFHCSAIGLTVTAVCSRIGIFAVLDLVHLQGHVDTVELLLLDDLLGYLLDLAQGGHQQADEDDNHAHHRQKLDDGKSPAFFEFVFHLHKLFSLLSELLLFHPHINLHRHSYPE